MKNMINYTGILENMLIDKGYRVQRNSWLYEHALKEDLEGKSILDYGCNHGNFLNSIPDDLNFSYTGIDVQEDFINNLLDSYEEHKFIHLNKYHPSYNFTGNKKIKLENAVPEKYDVIFAWNVFTHCTYEYTKECLEEMKLCLKDNGKIIFNLYSKEQLFTLSYAMVKKGDRLNGSITPLSSIDSFNNYVYWINGQTLSYDTTIEGNLSSLLTAYNIDWVNSDNSDWTLRNNYQSRIHTFTIGG